METCASNRRPFQLLAACIGLGATLGTVRGDAVAPIGECADDESSAERFLIGWPCDPGECHIYFGQQRRALPTIFSAAVATNRTLVLPPFTFYDGQAQQFSNAFKKQEEGQRPLFTPVGDLLDLAGLQKSAPDLRLVELRDWLASGHTLDIDLMFLSKGLPQHAVNEKRIDPNKDSSIFVDYECATHEGIMKNLSAGGSGELWEQPREAVRVAEKRCTYAMLTRLGTTSGGMLGRIGESLEAPEAFARRRTVALLGVGHQLHAHLNHPDSAAWVRGLRFAPRIVGEAERFMLERLVPAIPDSAPDVHAKALAFVAVHWRHGDYVAYRHATGRETVLKKALEALERLQCPTCPVFLLTNCEDRAEIDALRSELIKHGARLVMYEPQAGAPGSGFRREGERLSVDQAIASRAAVFVKTGRSAVSTFVDAERTNLGVPTSKDFNI